MNTRGIGLFHVLQRNECISVHDSHAGGQEYRLLL